MDYFLTEEQIMIKDLARQIAEEKIVPVRAELDKQESFMGHMKVLANRSWLFIPRNTAVWEKVV
jgi:butyryl-CoA dehydrogenase